MWAVTWPRSVARVVADLDEQLGATVGGVRPAPVAVGVGAPGMVDRQGRLCFAPNLPQAQGVDWNELIGDQLPGRTVLIENDANFAVLAEHRIGAAVGHDHVVMVTLGTGIGGGLVVDGRVQVGAAGFAGEIGHMVVDPAGPPCPCGRRGCWERFASGAGLGAAGPRGRPGRTAGRGGPAGRRRCRERAGRGRLRRGRGRATPAHSRSSARSGGWIGFGLANLAALLDPAVLRARAAAWWRRATS